MKASIVISTALRTIAFFSATQILTSFSDKYYSFYSKTSINVIIVTVKAALQSY